MRTILLFSLLIAASCCGQVIDTGYYEKDMSPSPYVIPMIRLYGSEDTVPISRPNHHDTLYEYVAKIDTVEKSIRGTKDDTGFVYCFCGSMHTKPDCPVGYTLTVGEFVIATYPEKVCYDCVRKVCDTTWAKKVQVWLRPYELDRLMQLIHPEWIEYDTLNQGWIIGL